MKTLLLLALFALAVPFAACTDVSHSSRTKTNWDGSVTHEDTTVKESPTGKITVDQSKTTTR